MEIKKTSIESNKVRLFAIHRSPINENQFESEWWGTHTVPSLFFKIAKVTTELDNANEKFLHQVELISRLNREGYDSNRAKSVYELLLDEYKRLYPITDAAQINKLENQLVYI